VLLILCDELKYNRLLNIGSVVQNAIFTNESGSHFGASTDSILNVTGQSDALMLTGAEDRGV